MNNRQQLKLGFGIGVIGGLAMSLVMGAAYLMDWTSLSLEMIWGSLFTRSLGTGTWILGFVIHLAFSGLVGILYSLGFRAIRKAGWAVGAAFSLPHWILGGMALGMFQYFHPVMPGLIPVPGYLGSFLGPETFLALFLSHLAYGVTVGSLYTPTLDQRLVGRLDEEAELPQHAAA